MSENNNINIGRIGENIACNFLIGKKYKILLRNHREGSDEIDIIAKSFDGVLVFVEVKALKEGVGDLIPEDHLTKSKLNKISRACRIFAGFHRELVDERKGWRIDLVAVTLGDGENKISHYENITA